MNMLFLLAAVLVALVCRGVLTINWAMVVLFVGCLSTAADRIEEWAKRWG